MSREFKVKRIDSRCLVAAVLSAFSFCASDAEAQLTGGQVVAGQATISSPSATSTLIHQTSQNTIINWSGFSIPLGSSVAFQQPNANSIALNRVTGGSVSQIYGTLTANGRVWLSNPNGIVLGPSAQVSAAGVLLSTMGIRDQDFLAGNYDFGLAGNPNAVIVNGGRIVATDGGSVVLAAPQVRNDGLIEADLGTVVLAGAKTVTVDFAGDDLLRFAVPSAAVENVAAGTDALVSNAGRIAAAGGRVLLTAAAAKGVLDHVINTSGIVEATSVASVNGKIVLSATGGSAQAGGTLDASGKGTGETGGTIEVLGDAVRVASGARLDATGDAGGGSVVVGGNFRGAGPEPNAQTTVVEAGSLIDASAITRGDGGRVAVWSDGSTSFMGDIRARGGAESGNGGFVETSGHSLFVADSAHVDTRAPRGATGTWLLDPDSIDIVGGGGDTTDEFSTGNFTCSANGCTLTASTIVAELANNNVTVKTDSGNITVDAPIVPNGIVGTQGPSNGSLSLISGADIVLNANLDFSGGGGSVILSAANGAITQSDVSITLGFGVLSMTAKTGIGTPSSFITVGSDNCCAVVTASTQSGGVFISSIASVLVVDSGGIRGGTGPVFLSAPGASEQEVVLVGDITTQGAPVTIESNILVSGMGEGGSFGFSLSDPTVDTTGGTGGANITFTSNGNIDGPAPLTLKAGKGTVSVGDIGFSDPISISVIAAAFSYGSIDPNSSFTFTQGNNPPVITDPNVQQQIVPHPPGTLPIETETPPIIIGISPPFPFILTASGPTSGPDQSGGGGDTFLTSVLDLDIGAQLFTQIAPNWGVSGSEETLDPLTIIVPITPATQPLPQPQNAEEPVGGTGSSIYRARNFVPTLPGVPGVDQPSLGAGNRGLWFAAPNPTP